MEEHTIITKENIAEIVEKLGKETREFDGRTVNRLSVLMYSAVKAKYNGQGPTAQGLAAILKDILVKEKFKKTSKEVTPSFVGSLWPSFAVPLESKIEYKEIKEMIRPELPGDLPKGNWSEQSLRVLKERYLWKDLEGNIIETADELCWRVAFDMASAELNFGKNEEDVLAWAREYYKLMVSLKFLPNSPTLMNAGKKNGLQYSACFVLPIGDSLVEIFDAVKYASIVHQSGGGTGFSFSRIRPAGCIVKSTRGISSGPISFLRVFNAATQEIKQGGSRRGANMAILRVDHPDVLEFIHCKEDGGITNFNISVGITDRFMEALSQNGDYELIAPHNKEAVGKMSARKVWDEICQAAWKTGDPGLFFIDRANRGSANPVPSLGPVESTNPCGEQPLYPNDVCNLGSIFLTYFVKEEKGKKTIDFDELASVVRMSVRFLDSVIEKNPYPLPQIMEIAKNIRRIGLGVGGWADVLAQLSIPYGSEEALTLAEKVMKFVNDEGHKASEELAKERGAFPLFAESIYKDGKPIRNATVTTIAPTGTISIIANASSGIEPYFALAYRHIVKDRGLDRNMLFVNRFFEQVLKDRGIYTDSLMEEILTKGTAHEVAGIPEDIKEAFLTAHEITPEAHIKMQAAFQKYTDNAVSKTINLPSTATVLDIEKAYLLAYETGCKGTTVFRDGCKGTQVLNVGSKESSKDATQMPQVEQSTKNQEENEAAVSEKVVGTVKNESPELVEAVTLRPRMYKIPGWTYRVETPVGTAFITINSDELGNPLEVFVNVGKAGMDVTADAQAIGRLISLALRIPTNYSSKNVAYSIIEQLSGIGGSSTLGFGSSRVRSLADAVAKVLDEHLKNNIAKVVDGANGLEETLGITQQTLPMTEKTQIEFAPKKRKGDLCPSCGNAALVFEEGCHKCYSCGYSKC